jgi:hypothetical protein
MAQPASDTVRTKNAAQTSPKRAAAGHPEPS